MPSRPSPSQCPSVPKPSRPKAHPNILIESVFVSLAERPSLRLPLGQTPAPRISRRVSHSCAPQPQVIPPGTFPVFVFFIFLESRIRKETIAAEDVLHDIGAISMISSDSQAMGRVGEVVSRTWRTASKMRNLCGPLTELGDFVEHSNGQHDNGRVKRYIAKYTINPAITHGISHVVGDVSVGKLADLVLWKPENFGAKPEIVLKSGVIVWAQIGEPNGSIPTVQPFTGRPMWGALPASAALNSVSFVSQVSLDDHHGGHVKAFGLNKRLEAVRGCRGLKKTDMKLNGTRPRMKVDPESYEVRADDRIMDVEAAKRLPLARFYNIF
ncbi:hypothetical protein LXA43DRAFT_957229 [Ganoderma leucocontextum]|nr:hypothetical protein LXA43DRAFT_957229 [Ganoderma leucocontextum]